MDDKGAFRGGSTDSELETVLYNYTL